MFCKKNPEYDLNPFKLSLTPFISPTNKNTP